MSSPDQILTSIRNSIGGSSVTELLAIYPKLSRRTMQRWLRELIDAKSVKANGQGPASRYYADHRASAAAADAYGFPDFIPLSQDSRDVLSYVDQPLEARKPVGFRRDFLDAYEPNRSWYLSEPLRRQLRKMGDTGQGGLPAGTHGREILNRLLIDLSWASSHLEGNT